MILGIETRFSAHTVPPESITTTSFSLVLFLRLGVSLTLLRIASNFRYSSLHLRVAEIKDMNHHTQLKKS
jgi:hypothetical protein